MPIHRSAHPPQSPRVPTRGDPSRIVPFDRFCSSPTSRLSIAFRGRVSTPVGSGDVSVNLICNDAVPRPTPAERLIYRTGVLGLAGPARHYEVKAWALDSTGVVRLASTAFDQVPR